MPQLELCLEDSGLKGTPAGSPIAAPLNLSLTQLPLITVKLEACMCLMRVYSCLRGLSCCKEGLLSVAGLLWWKRPSLALGALFAPLGASSSDESGGRTRFPRASGYCTAGYPVTASQELAGQPSTPSHEGPPVESCAHGDWWVSRVLLVAQPRLGDQFGGVFPFV